MASYGDDPHQHWLDMNRHASGCQKTKYAPRSTLITMLLGAGTAARHPRNKLAFELVILGID
jgi:hypothetical protein